MGLNPGIRRGEGPRGGRGPLLRTLALTAFAAVLLAVPALADGLRPNPANDHRLLERPIDDEHYDYARSCKHRIPPGMKALQSWLERNVRG